MSLFRCVFLLSIIASLFLGCTPDPTASNFLSLEIDGEYWEANNIQTTVNQLGALFAVDISAKNAENELIYLKIYSLSAQGSGTYFITNLENHTISYAPSGSLNTGEVYHARLNCLNNNNAYIQITAYGDFRISGTFEGKVCLPSGTQKTIRIGRFNGLAFQ
jgi:hypothetical protein